MKFALLLSLLALPVLSFAEAPKSTGVPATTPMQRPEPGWNARHATFNEISKQGTAQLVFLGDSITQGWEGAGKEAWTKHFAPLNAAGFGIGGDRTEHVLWRLENGNFTGLKPKAIVLLIGTNNTGHQGREGYLSPADETAQGVKAIIAKLQQLTPDSKILLLGIFPRGADPTDKMRQQNEATNAIIKNYADDQKVFFMDIGEKFLVEGGVLPPDIMPDKLHLTPKGYEIWASAIEGKVKELMQ
ncbi:GDSL family lipase [Phragmitibacter flavus]|uniref:GDSL family lipase n=1 Tax=Phragmitibacter flavus TaxID=2576071 RepID=A0A5R8KCW3_9BACT|nr:platelet-activating factor acetylhydrolase IB subunit [Phragmitibacter flavus]TLD70146.1 GDSL family lipase [Phragmitibacter flavus]